jgi:hypothetical protein
MEDNDDDGDDVDYDTDAEMKDWDDTKDDNKTLERYPPFDRNHPNYRFILWISNLDQKRLYCADDAVLVTDADYRDTDETLMLCGSVWRGEPFRYYYSSPPTGTTDTEAKRSLIL